MFIAKWILVALTLASIAFLLILTLVLGPLGSAIGLLPLVLLWPFNALFAAWERARLRSSILGGQCPVCIGLVAYDPVRGWVCDTCERTWSSRRIGVAPPGGES